MLQYPPAQSQYLSFYNCSDGLKQQTLSHWSWSHTPHLQSSVLGIPQHEDFLHVLLFQSLVHPDSLIRLLSPLYQRLHLLHHPWFFQVSHIFHNPVLLPDVYDRRIPQDIKMVALTLYFQYNLRWCVPQYDAHLPVEYFLHNWLLLLLPRQPGGHPLIPVHKLHRLRLYLPSLLALPALLLLLPD